MKMKIAHTPMSAGHAGDPGPGEMTMLSKARSLYTRLKTSLHVHSSLRTTTGGTAKVSRASVSSTARPRRHNEHAAAADATQRHPARRQGRDVFLLTAVDDRQLLEDVVGVAVVVVDQQRPDRRRLRRVLPLRPPRREMARGADPDPTCRGAGGGRLQGRKRGPPRRRRCGEAERGHRGGARGWRIRRA